ncbi:hypothetical protein TIFTF001_035384 [Ficus carica]|uniref:Uncharacterized protein n=1 Tax=Ficus carica TaxID=3494 RepID=A0AA88EAE2_FICCA|nr:hypothetical protein TIFTF001_035381 [Ficus carica]GMN66319.1 hypothetical protein TIFTF001_035384 [Ficus carica]
MTFLCKNTISEPPSSSSLQQPPPPFFLATARNHHRSPSRYPPFLVVTPTLIIFVNLNISLSLPSKRLFLPHHLHQSQFVFLLTNKLVLYPKMLCQQFLEMFSLEQNRHLLQLNSWFFAYGSTTSSIIVG